MQWWQTIISYFVAPAVVGSGLIYLIKVSYGHLLDRAKTGFEKKIEHKWEIKIKIQDAMTDAYECLEGLKEEYDKLNEELMKDSTTENNLIIRPANLAKLEMYVDLWIPEFDDALSELKEKLKEFRDVYHRFLILFNNLNKFAQPDEEIVPSLLNYTFLGHRIGEYCHGNGSQFQFSGIDSIQHISSGVMHVEISLRIRN